MSRSRPIFTPFSPKKAFANEKGGLKVKFCRGLELGFVILFSTSLGYFLMPFGMKYLRATTVSVYMNLQPIVASIAAICVGQDVFSWDKPIAAILVLAGAYIVSTSPSKQQVDVKINNKYQKHGKESTKNDLSHDDSLGR